VCPTFGGTPCLALDGTTLIGREIEGRYTLLDVIAVGGMGAVFAARQHTTGREVAIKMLPAAASRQRDAVLRFVSEAKALSRLTDPHTVGVVDFGRSHDGLLYLVMELLKGRTLDTVIEQEGALPVPRALQICSQVLDALESAHGAGIIHRDIKPGNLIILDSYNHRDFVKVLDFGVALLREEADKEDLGLAIGSPAFMAPEQITGDPVDARADLYALGSVLFYMLCGRRPFPYHDSATVLDAKVCRPAPLLNGLDPSPGVPSQIERFVANLLSLYPEERPASAREARVLLASAMAELSDDGFLNTSQRVALRRRRPVSQPVRVSDAGRMLKTLVAAQSLKRRAAKLFATEPIVPSSTALASLRDALAADEETLRAWLGRLTAQVRLGEAQWDPYELRGLRRTSLGQAVLDLSDDDRRELALDLETHLLFEKALTLQLEIRSFWETEMAGATDLDRRQFAQLMTMEEQGYLAELRATRDLIKSAARAHLTRVPVEADRTAVDRPGELLERMGAHRHAESFGFSLDTPSASHLTLLESLPPRLVMGIEEIDTQHAQAIDLARAILRFDGADRAPFCAMIESLCVLAANHFGDEEAAMALERYPAFAAHREQHDLLREQALRMRETCRAGANVAHLQGLAGLLVADWIVAHIERADRAYANWLKRRGRPTNGAPNDAG